MFFVLSPAKNLNETPEACAAAVTVPRFLPETAELTKILQTYSPQALAALMHISDKLALLNVERFHRLQQPFPQEKTKPAVFLFNGDVYEGLDAGSLTETAVSYLQKHLGILSGLYGLLRPLDAVMPYRLEMGTKLPNARGKDLYAFWGDKISRCIAQQMKEQGDTVLVNLASEEYFKVLKQGKVPMRVVTPVFQDEKNGVFKIISFYAKRARGLMVRYAAERGLTDVEKLKNFDCEGYRFIEAASDGKKWVFQRAEQDH